MARFRLRRGVHSVCDCASVYLRRGCPQRKDDQIATIKKQSLTDDEKRVVKDLLNAVAILRAKNPKMTLQQLTALLLVAHEENQQVVTYAKRAGIVQGVMTRHLFDLGDYSRTREEGLGLVEQRPDIMDRRSHLTSLTVKGRSLIHDVIRAVRR